jgi:hypothetical protein
MTTVCHFTFTTLHRKLHTLTNSTVNSLQLFNYSEIPRIWGKPHVHYRTHNRCYKLHPPHPSPSAHPNNTRWTVPTSQLLTVPPSPSTCPFHPLTTKYFPQHCILTDGQDQVLHCNVSGSWPLHSHTAAHNYTAVTHFAICFSCLHTEMLR